MDGITQAAPDSPQHAPYTRDQRRVKLERVIDTLAQCQNELDSLGLTLAGALLDQAIVEAERHERA